MFFTCPYYKSLIFKMFLNLLSANSNNFKPRMVIVSDSWPGGCEFDPWLRRRFFLACFRLSPLQEHVRKVVGGFGKKSCSYWCEKARKHIYVTDRHDMTLDVKVALNPNTTNQPILQFQRVLKSFVVWERVRKLIFFEKEGHSMQPVLAAILTMFLALWKTLTKSDWIGCMQMYSIYGQPLWLFTLYLTEENIVGKGEIAHYEQFLLFPQCFQKLLVVLMCQNEYLWSKLLNL